MLNHQGTVRLETERLVLRPFVMADSAATFRNWRCDAEVTKYLTWPASTAQEIPDRVLESWIEAYEKPDFYQWAIVLKESGEAIGSISVVEMDERVDALELGYCIGRPWWGRGLTAEAGAAVIRFLFLQVGASRICARHDTNNPNSGKVMQKLGMQLEGIQRRSVRNNQGITDAACYSILRTEYTE